MLTLLAVLGVLVIFFVAAVVATREGEVLAEAPADTADLDLPSGPLQPEDVAAVRFGMALRGYRMAEVDSVLERLAGELAARDARILELQARPATTHAPTGAVALPAPSSTVLEPVLAPAAQEAEGAGVQGVPPPGSGVTQQAGRSDDDGTGWAFDDSGAAAAAARPTSGRGQGGSDTGSPGEDDWGMPQVLDPEPAAEGVLDAVDESPEERGAAAHAGSHQPTTSTGSTEESEGTGPAGPAWSAPAGAPPSPVPPAPEAGVDDPQVQVARPRTGGPQTVAAPAAAAVTGGSATAAAAASQGSSDPPDQDAPDREDPAAKGPADGGAASDLPATPPLGDPPAPLDPVVPEPEPEPEPVPLSPSPSGPGGEPLAEPEPVVPRPPLPTPDPLRERGGSSTPSGWPVVPGWREAADEEDGRERPVPPPA